MTIIKYDNNFYKKINVENLSKRELLELINGVDNATVKYKHKSNTTQINVILGCSKISYEISSRSLVHEENLYVTEELNKSLEKINLRLDNKPKHND